MTDAPRSHQGDATPKLATTPPNQTAVTPGVCLVHGYHGRTSCPTCSTAVSQPLKPRQMEAVYMTPMLPTQAEVDAVLSRFSRPAITPSEWADAVAFGEYARTVGYQPTAAGCALYVLGKRGVVGAVEA